MYNKVLLATDGSETAAKAAEFVVELKKTLPSAQVTVVFVDELRVLNTVFDWKLDDRLLAEIKEASKDRMTQALGFFENAGVDVSTVRLEGDPGAEIVKYARDGGFDNIVMGSRGLGSLGSVFLGSVVQKVLHGAPCPVTIIRGD
ncbi:MAG: universal stress protein [Eubacteriales bacterium]|nr:universal stress protein [Bacillota bacterium]MBV1727792.1 universal stress protein [Desulforudis sp.]MDP3051673.1 universal stress protein [Eubacteriales bacterium]MDQ7790021.1 universal stress protein [Clostridia bacterium]MBU4554163.1 universal stress protein [Bacillota bacterium]